MDSALERFDQLRVRAVELEDGDTVATLVARFQSTAADLEPNERIQLEVAYVRNNMHLLKAVLSDPQASKICTLHWQCRGEEEVNSVVPLLIKNCPELAALRADFTHHSSLDFLSSVLERPGNKIKVLEMPEQAEGNIPRFFAALGQSQVSALTLSVDGPPRFVKALCEYLARDLLVRLELDMNSQEAPPKVMASLAKCTRLADLRMSSCEFSKPTACARLPKSITKLELTYCTFADGFKWSFLAGSNVQELDLDNIEDVDGSQLGSALAALLRAKGLDELRLCNGDFTDETLAAVGVELCRVKELHVQDDNPNDASFELIALALQSPNSELRVLVLPYESETASSIQTCLVPALSHPNCRLAELSFWAFQEHGEAAKTLEDRFRKRRALLVLLQGQQVRRLYCPLQRLPVEMFRLVGEVLM